MRPNVRVLPRRMRSVASGRRRSTKRRQAASSSRALTLEHEEKDIFVSEAHEVGCFTSNNAVESPPFGGVLVDRVLKVLRTHAPTQKGLLLLLNDLVLKHGRFLRSLSWPPNVH